MRTFLSLLSLALLTIGLVATAASADLVEDDTRFFLNRGADCTETFLALTPGDGGGCGDRGLNEVFIQAEGQPFFDYVTSTNGTGMPLVIDASRNLTGQIGIGPDGAGTGTVQVDLTLTGTAPDSFTPETIATATMTDDDVTNVTGVRELAFDVDIDEALHKAEYESLTLELVVHGTYVNHGFVEHDATSNFLVPTLVEAS